jgi:hypothetical protein
MSLYKNFFGKRGEGETPIPDNEFAVLTDLDWISCSQFNPLGPEAYHEITEQGLDYASEGDYETLVNSAKAYFPDVCGAHGLDPSIIPTYPTEDEIAKAMAKFDEQPPESKQRTNECFVLAAIQAILPDAELGMDNDGQIIVYTGLTEVEYTSTPIYAGRFNKPAVGIGEAPEGYDRIMVLDDGETYSSLDGCSIREVPSDLDDTAEIDYALKQASHPHERDEDLVEINFVAAFDGNGLEV